MDKLIFNPKVAKNKPRDVSERRNITTCPFCNTEELVDIMKIDGSKIWLMNKFRTLENTFQTVVIESDKHDGDFSNYSDDEANDIVEFAIDAWQEMIDSKKYKSVAMFKNFGPYSGGSLHHPHLQIVGFDNIDCMKNIESFNFEGTNVVSEKGVSMNISDNPIMGFVELNIILHDKAKMTTFSKWINNGISYFINDYQNGRCNSYNLFFYQNKNDIVAKIVPRYNDSPYFVGYKIPQVNCDQRVIELTKELQNYINKKS
ncbi:DUF4931 domain-containing protein [Companilactobacillus sp. RD055328]|uniref:DUF4931 domain-containing protein n=1 Tax=Companilactobacillus sp. RD055328 TaxID=2916634 RepID=UPI001FC8E94E|nr:DUF4931 domain-containing protein [Companilactobacillus sp. RD055328]GKQ43250.1 DUF4931 domain-containing protein [Companilactobacillus sp. RD055328]